MWRNERCYASPACALALRVANSISLGQRPTLCCLSVWACCAIYSATACRVQPRPYTWSTRQLRIVRLVRAVLLKERLYQRLLGGGETVDVPPDPTSGWASPRSDAPLEPLSSEHLSALAEAEALDGESPVLSGRLQLSIPTAAVVASGHVMLQPALRCFVCCLLVGTAQHGSAFMFRTTMVSKHQHVMSCADQWVASQLDTAVSQAAEAAAGGGERRGSAH